MKSTICTYVPPCVEVVEAELESGVLTNSKAGAGSEGLTLDDIIINLFGL